MIDITTSDVTTYGGWITEKPIATGSSFKRSVINTSLAILFTAGLAGLLISSGTENSLPLESFPQYGYLQYDQSEEYTRNAYENLLHIREILSPSIAELASALGVSRQSIYNWINGEQIAEENSSKLQNIAQAADIISSARGLHKSTILKRKIANGKTFFELVKNGESPQNAADTLVQIHQRESIQRDHIKAQFADRKRTPATADFDIPAPNDYV
jgi:transcriptional regulator with XRE-family HTH domain